MTLISTITRERVKFDKVITMKKYDLITAFHPTAFAEDTYVVQFVEKGKPLFDRYTKLLQVQASSREEAIKKAKKELGKI